MVRSAEKTEGDELDAQFPYKETEGQYYLIKVTEQIGLTDTNCM